MWGRGWEQTEKNEHSFKIYFGREINGFADGFDMICGREGLREIQEKPLVSSFSNWLGGRKC